MEENAVEITEIFDLLYLHEKELTPGQIDFVRSVKRYYIREKQLSERQLSILLEIKKYLIDDDEIRYSKRQL